MSHKQEMELARELGEKIGYGNAMHWLSILWRESNRETIGTPSGGFVPALLSDLTGKPRAEAEATLHHYDFMRVANTFPRIKQTRFGEGVGNCFQACLASILNLPLESCPDIAKMSDETWFDEVSQWLRSMGYVLEYTAGVQPRNGFAIACGKTKRGPQHAVVMYGGKYLHDPHPDDMFLNGNPPLYYLKVWKIAK